MSESIRAATPEDASAIAACRVESWRAAYDGLMPAELLAGLDPVANAVPLRERLAHQPERWSLWVLEEGGELVGYCTTGPTRDDDLDAEVVGEVYGLYLWPKFWGRGYGRTLMLHAFGAFCRLSFREVSLWCLEGNRRAERFYAAAGFHRDGPTVSKPVAGHELPHVRFRRELREIRAGNS